MTSFPTVRLPSVPPDPVPKRVRHHVIEVGRTFTTSHQPRCRVDGKPCLHLKECKMTCFPDTNILVFFICTGTTTLKVDVCLWYIPYVVHHRENITLFLCVCMVAFGRLCISHGRLQRARLGLIQNGETRPFQRALVQPAAITGTHAGHTHISMEQFESTN